MKKKGFFGKNVMEKKVFFILQFDYWLSFDAQNAPISK